MEAHSKEQFRVLNGPTKRHQGVLISKNTEGITTLAEA
jgi:hypothetical protein